MEINVELQGVTEVLKSFKQAIQAEERALIQALEYLLRAMVKHAKDNKPPAAGAFEDHTGNLRNSISVNFGLMQEWPANTAPSVLRGLARQNEIPMLDISGDNYYGYLSAGMEYAIYVELLEGFWVIQGTVDVFAPLIEQYLADHLAVEKLDLAALEQIAGAQYEWAQRRGG